MCFMVALFIKDFSKHLLFHNWCNKADFSVWDPYATSAHIGCIPTCADDNILSTIRYWRTVPGCATYIINSKSNQFDIYNFNVRFDRSYLCKCWNSFFYINLYENNPTSEAPKARLYKLWTAADVNVCNWLLLEAFDMPDALGLTDKQWSPLVHGDLTRFYEPNFYFFWLSKRHLTMLLTLCFDLSIESLHWWLLFIFLCHYVSLNVLLRHFPLSNGDSFMAYGGAPFLVSGGGRAKSSCDVISLKRNHDFQDAVISSHFQHVAFLLLCRKLFHSEFLHLGCYKLDVTSLSGNKSNLGSLKVLEVVTKQLH